MDNILFMDAYCLEILRKKKLNMLWKGCCLLVEKECCTLVELVIFSWQVHITTIKDITCNW